MQRILIALSQLKVNPDINPRHSSDDSVADLVAQISANGFTDALWVRQVEDDFYEVIDGSRRLRALQQLEWMDAVPVDLIEADDARARELALAANVTRADLSPADEAVAFNNLAKGGMAAADIAAHFAVPERRVRQRMAIGNLPAVIITALREERMNVKAAEAFTVSPSAERQIDVFAKLAKSGNLQEWSIRRELTEQQLRADSGKAKFVGLEAYLAAGGEVSEDLFQEHTWLTNLDLLDKLFGEKLASTLEAFKNDGWNWVKVLEGNEAHEAYKYDREAPRAKRTLTDVEKLALAEARKQLKALEEEHFAIERDDVSELTEEQERRLEELPDLIDIQEEIITGLTATSFTKKQKAALGVLVCIDNDGDVDIHEGRRKKGEKPKADQTPDPDAGSVDTGDAQDDTPPAPIVTEEAGYSDALSDSLRLVARDATKLAMAVVKPALAARMGLAARVSAFLDQHHDAPFHTVARGDDGGEKFDLLCQAYADLFKDADSFAAVLAVLETMTPEAVVMLDATIAACLFKVDALRNTDAQWVINQIDADMTAEGFTPDEAFFGRLSRDQIALISAEINPDAPLKKLKKPEMVEAILPLAAQSNWLPPQLRTPRYQGPGSAAWLDKLSSPAPQAGEGGAQAPAEGQPAANEDEIEEAA